MELADKCFSRSFDTIREGDREYLDSFFESYDYRSAYYSFLSNYLWRRDYARYWDVIDGYLVIGRIYNGENGPEGAIWMPFTGTGTYDREGLRNAVYEMKRRMNEAGTGMNIEGVPAHMLPVLEDAFGDKLMSRRDRNFDEYVYEKEKLITLSGRALHKKRNHLNYFLNNYDFRTRPLTKDDFADILRLTDSVRSEHNRTEEQAVTLEQEKRAIRIMFEFIGNPDIYTVAVIIKDEMQAYAIGEMKPDGTAVEHFEKANLEYRGLYQAVLSEFCKALPEECEFVNREEDMGLESLRHAKTALRPHHMIEKYVCSVE